MFDEVVAGGRKKIRIGGAFNLVEFSKRNLNFNKLSHYDKQTLLNASRYYYNFKVFQKILSNRLTQYFQSAPVDHPVSLSGQ